MPDPAASAAMSREADRSSLDDADRWLSAEMAARKEEALGRGEGYAHMAIMSPEGGVLHRFRSGGRSATSTAGDMTVGSAGDSALESARESGVLESAEPAIPESALSAWLRRKSWEKDFVNLPAHPKLNEARNYQSRFIGYGSDPMEPYADLEAQKNRAQDWGHHPDYENTGYDLLILNTPDDPVERRTFLQDPQSGEVINVTGLVKEW